MSAVETPHRIGGGRWLPVNVDAETVIDLHGDAVAIERVHEGEPWRDGPLYGVAPAATVGVRVELRADQVDGRWYSMWAPSEDLSEAIGVLVAEVDS